MSEKIEWSVRLPIAGYLVIEVEAETEEEAIEAALVAEYDNSHIEEWSAYRSLSQGNVINVSPHRADAERIA